MNGERLISRGRLAELFQRSISDIDDALTARHIAAALVLNDVAYFPHRAISELRDYFNSQDASQWQKPN